ncbi:class I SAM-dependent methyltransferase [Streptomyces silvisoli]|uniref:Methyltransferase domain-containing protein n=1 Tax=Streptomyces silvisoli TaxID=3034235 RepID=A0ABT5ZIC7_9ACTN|nr:methyltransferase domain-containing protein [Streptomyces silvisoli]MDF3289580.1 methyltransferase domain-containing protein [Streptomyces silvisoli]
MTVLPRVLDAVFGHPRGLAGRLGGALMARGNAGQERWAVSAAGLHPEEHVLVVGPGPGVGLALAAEAVGPDGLVVGVDPSATMRRLAQARCAAPVTAEYVRVRAGRAERTDCEDASMDAVISVNNVMLWDRPAGFRELLRVLRPGGRLVITVHRHVLGVPPQQVVSDAVAAGFVEPELTFRRRRATSDAVQLLLRRPAP